ncbi:MAG TPA: hypothetical protein VM307_12110 [Egibacteraceae bacterium]|nr:hypothetical protein [Egibacteraceae bacterium]
MTKPQQPELRRSGLGSTDMDSAKFNADDEIDTGGNVGPVPEENQPGHRPAKDQDKPEPPG